MSGAYYHLAEVNIARAVAPMDSPLMADFAAQLAEINAVADVSPGFVWRLATDEGDATAIQAYDDPLILFNLSVWESLESLREYTYRSGHRGPLQDRLKWFERPTQPNLAMWWIPAGHIPGVDEAVERLEYRRAHGDTAVAFWFANSFPMPDAPASEPEAPQVNLDGRILRTASNTPNGDAGAATRFRYRQSGARVWATYAGGSVRFGSLVAVGNSEGRLDMRYHHVSRDGDFRTGICVAVPEVLPDGRIRLREEWQWTNGDRSRGQSVVEEAE